MGMYRNPLMEGLFDGGQAVGICFILALIATIVLAFTFLPASKESSLKGFSLSLHRFMNFKTMISLGLLKFIYALAAIYITLFSLYMLTKSFLPGLLMLILGNLGVRIGYELLVLIFSIHSNLTQINLNTANMNKTTPTYQSPQTPVQPQAQPVQPPVQPQYQPPVQSPVQPQYQPPVANPPAPPSDTN